MRRAVTVAVLLCAATAAGGELIRFRSADGTIGLVDHPSKLPPGATVLQRSQPTERAPDPAPGLLPTFTPSEPAQRRPVYEEPRSPAGSDSWCQRGRDAANRVQNAEESLAAAEDSYERCDDTEIANYCSHSRVESAERELESAQEALSRLEEDCRVADCDPGWLRCAP